MRSSTLPYNVLQFVFYEVFQFQSLNSLKGYNMFVFRQELVFECIELVAWPLEISKNVYIILGYFWTFLGLAMLFGRDLFEGLVIP